MVDQRQVCGTVPITYPSDCTYVCVCNPQFGCNWSVKCGDWTTGGRGLAAENVPGEPHKPHVTIHGDLEVAAELLAKGWKRTVKVPEGLRGKLIKRKRTIEGTPEEIAKALGLELGPRRKGADGKQPAKTG